MKAYTTCKLIYDATSKYKSHLVFRDTMLNRMIIYFLIIFHIFPCGAKENSSKNPFFSKLATRSDLKKTQSFKRNNDEFKCKYKCVEETELSPKILGRARSRFIDSGTNDTVENNEMEAPAGKFSIFNFLPDDGEEEEEEDDDDDDDEDDEDDDDDDGDDEEKEENDHDIDKENDGDAIVNGTQSDDDDDDFDFLSSEEASDKLDDTNEEGLVKQYHRHGLRMNNLVFPLLLAYKLKFFMVIPLLLGTLVLLVGTTGVAGFFFALFAAALGIHVKSQEH